MPIGAGSGPGGKAGDIRAGGAVYEITGVDHLSGKLARVQANTQQWASKMNGTVNQAIQGLALGGSIAGLTGAVAMLGREWIETAGNVRKYVRELERATELAGKIEAITERTRQKRFKEVEGLAPDQGLKELQRDLALAEKNALGLQNALAAARKREEGLHFGRDFLTASAVDLAKMSREQQEQVKEAIQLFLGRGLEAAQEEAKNNLEEAKRRLDANQKLMQELRDRIEGMQESAPFLDIGNVALKAAQETAKNLADEFERARDAARGMGDNLEESILGPAAEAVRLERMIADLKRVGAPQSDINRLRSLFEMRQAMEAEQEAERLKNLPKQTTEIRQTILGTFGGGNLAQELGIGPNGIQQRQLDELKKVGINTGDIKMEIGQLAPEIGDAVVNGLRLK